MMAALKSKGFKPPPGTKTKRAVQAPAGKPIPKQEAISHVADGKAIPAPVLNAMGTKGWSGPGVGGKGKREIHELYAREADAMAAEINNFARDLEAILLARDAEADFEERDLYERDAYPEAYFEERDLFERDAYPEAYFEERDALPESYFYERDAIPEPYFFERDAEAIESY